MVIPKKTINCNFTILCTYWCCFRALCASCTYDGHLYGLLIQSSMFLCPLKQELNQGVDSPPSIPSYCWWTAGQGSFTVTFQKSTSLETSALKINWRFNWPFSLLVVLKQRIFCLDDTTIILKVWTSPPGGLIIPVIGCNCFLFLIVA